VVLLRLEPAAAMGQRPRPRGASGAGMCCVYVCVCVCVYVGREGGRGGPAETPREAGTHTHNHSLRDLHGAGLLLQLLEGVVHHLAVLRPAD
jgi:hypothetical protein